METTKNKQSTANQTSSNAQEPKRLSKVGEWLRSGQSIGTIVDMKAVLR